jgi:hypothetical protein
MLKDVISDEQQFLQSDRALACHFEEDHISKEATLQSVMEKGNKDPMPPQPDNTPRHIS